MKNVSSLICDLITKHFNANPVDVDEVESMNLGEIRDKKLILLDALTNPTTTISDLEKFKTAIKVLEEKEKGLLETEEEKKEKADNKKQQHKKLQEGYLKEWFIIEDKEIPDLLLMYEAEKYEYQNLFEWGVAKGLQEKEIEEEETTTNQ